MTARSMAARLLGHGLRAPIQAYRLLLSPMLGSNCRFAPSCSCYALQAIDVHGPVRGLALAIARIMRCNPFHPGGHDPVPPASPSHRDRPAQRWT